MAMGTSQMLTCMEERLKQLDASADVTCFGQELNPFTFGIAKADMLIRGGDPDNMKFGNTLDDDRFKLNVQFSATRRFRAAAVSR